MKKFIGLCLAALVALAPASYSQGGGHGHSRSSHKARAPSDNESSDKVHVNGYSKKDGAIVAPHDRTAPNHTKKDNWSTKGNLDPETGKPGTKADTMNGASP